MLLRSTKRRVLPLAAAVAIFTGGAAMSGCQNDAQTGALFGGGLGAIGGAVIGHQSGHGGEGAAIGAGAGALLGYIIGNESDKARHDYYYHHGGRANYDY